MTEAQIQSNIIKYLKQNNYIFVKVHGTNRAGWPDLTGSIKGIFVGIEVKKLGGRLSKLQIKTINAIRLQGGIAGVAYNIDDAKELVNLALEKAKYIPDNLVMDLIPTKDEIL